MSEAGSLRHIEAILDSQDASRIQSAFALIKRARGSEDVIDRLTQFVRLVRTNIM